MTWLVRKRLACACVVAALLALAGCAAVPIKVDKLEFDPALFPRQPAETRFDGRMAVLADPAVVEMTLTRERVTRLSGGPHPDFPYAVQMPIGRIVHEAALSAFADTFRGGASAVDRAGAERSAPTVVLRVVHYDCHNQLLSMVLAPLFPVPISAKWRLDMRLTIEVRLLDVDGAMMWSNAYDSGPRLWEPQERAPHAAHEGNFEELLRLTHETAYALMRSAARDVGHWQRNERLRERML